MRIRRARIEKYCGSWYVYSMVTLAPRRAECRDFVLYKGGSWDEAVRVVQHWLHVNEWMVRWFGL